MKTKKGNGFTNIYVLLFVLLIVSTFSFAIIQFGSSLATSSQSNLNTQSLEFIEEETGKSFTINNRSIDSDNFLSYTQKDEKFYVDEETVGDNPKDFALEFFWGLSTAKKIWDTIKTGYNLPSFFIRWLPIDAIAFQFLVNSFNLFFWASLAGAIIYVVRGYNIGRK